MKKKSIAKRCASAALAIVLAAAGVAVTSEPEEVYAAGTVNEAEQAGDENNSRATAEELPADTTMLGKIVYGEDEKETDYYKFTFKGKGYYTFSLENYEGITDVGNGWIMRIYDADMNENIKLSSYTEGIKTKLTSSPIAFDEGTVFYIKIYEYGDRKTNEAVYGLTASFIEDNAWESEGNDTITTADVIDDQKISGTLVTKDDVDYYKFTAPDTGYIKFFAENTLGDVDNVNDGWIMRAYDKDANELSANSFTTLSEASYRILKKGETVYFKINSCITGSWASYCPVDVQYTLNVSFKKLSSIEKENNGSFDKANNIKKSVYGVVGDSSNEHEEDYYKFTAKKSGNIKININIPDITYSWKVTVYDSNRNEIKSMTINSSKALKFKATKGKKYYICVTNTGTWGTWDYVYSYNILYKLTVK